MIYPFSSYQYKCENEVVRELLARIDWDAQTAKDVENRAATLVRDVREQKGKGGQLEVFLQEFSLNTEEGLAMMCLAEALLRIPDPATASLLIRDKVVAAQWLQKQGSDVKDWKAKAAGLGMAITRKTLDSAFAKLGEPVIREAMVRAMQMMGKQFVMGTTIEKAFSHGRQYERQGYMMSYDMLGEGARDAKSAERYFDVYMQALHVLIEKNDPHDNGKAGLSVKLSALHPRYCYAQKDRCVPAIYEKLKALCILAASGDVLLTVDAEEVNRLDLSVEIIEDILECPELKDWDGFGLAVQAYQKRALPLIDYLAGRARDTGQKIHVRLVKGAYWDTEIKIAQVGGFEEYPVFTRKCNTDLSYLACAQALFSYQDVIYPMFATHNAHTIAAIEHVAKQYSAPYEYQRLHGMGEALYAHVVSADRRVRIYAPVGPHEDLLPYLVRRLLENGANSSFVNQLLDHQVRAEDIVCDPVQQVHSYDVYRHSSISLPRDIFGQYRVNSSGRDLDNLSVSGAYVNFIEGYVSQPQPRSYVQGKAFDAVDERMIARAFDAAQSVFPEWNALDVGRRSGIIERFADLLEEHSKELMAILVHEAGKTIVDAQDELREAVDFCRYYAAQAKEIFDANGQVMPGYTGEENRLIMQGRGVFVCISPWNFPLAIFTGQIVAALMAGNAVIAKPASQTRYIATRTVELMHKAGVPSAIIQLLLGDGAFGGKIIAHEAVSGVAFTGSTATAKKIQQSLVVHNDAIVPFIAETGGQNAMIVDSSALLEQVIDDVLHSAFGSAGQRCSALRVLYVQEDIEERVLDLLRGAMAEMRIGDPAMLSTDVGYVIDEAAKRMLDEHVSYIAEHGDLIAKVELDSDLSDNGRFFAPIAYKISNIHVLKEEVFGPVLHVISYAAGDIDQVVEDINATGYGLTFGVHSRIEKVQRRLSSSVNAGNIYINRGMTGAVVGVQPFGGVGLSGSGPKAGGPHYLYAFAVEKVITTDTTASGGNASLVSLMDE
ncbi:MAG: bifunctional proline dehydrogenase/L-glutamate gamma-semialdehyde dehydrogenase PutA [Alphaproteobacteria bacterium]